MTFFQIVLAWAGFTIAFAFAMVACAAVEQRRRLDPGVRLTDEDVRALERDGCLTLHHSDTRT